MGVLAFALSVPSYTKRCRSLFRIFFHSSSDYASREGSTISYVFLSNRAEMMH